jgi:general secretion pathway protein K
VRAKPQRGVALILAMMLTAVFGLIAAGFFWQMNQWLARFEYRQHSTQAQSLAQAAVAWSAQLMGEDSRQNTIDHLGEVWAVGLPATPLGGGTLTGQIADAHARFNLTNINPKDPPAELVFKRLLRELNLDDTVYATLLATQPLRHESDFLNKLPAEAQAKLSPHLIVLPTTTRVNINTASAPVFAAVSPSWAPEARAVWLQKRVGQPANAGALASMGLEGVGVQSRYFVVSATAQVQAAQVSAQALLDRGEKPVIRAQVLWQVLQ